MISDWSMIWRGLLGVATAFGLSAVSTLAIQYYFKRRADKIVDVMQGPLGCLVTNKFIENAFKKWWVPVDKLLADAVWESCKPGDWCG